MKASCNKMSLTNQTKKNFCCVCPLTDCVRTGKARLTSTETIREVRRPLIPPRSSVLFYLKKEIQKKKQSWKLSLHSVVAAVNWTCGVPPELSNLSAASDCWSFTGNDKHGSAMTRCLPLLSIDEWVHGDTPRPFLWWWRLNSRKQKARPAILQVLIIDRLTDKVEVQDAFHVSMTTWTLQNVHHGAANYPDRKKDQGVSLVFSENLFSTQSWLKVRTFWGYCLDERFWLPWQHLCDNLFMGRFLR